jgi:hypothetical protein
MQWGEAIILQKNKEERFSFVSLPAEYRPKIFFWELLFGAGDR